MRLIEGSSRFGMVLVLIFAVAEPAWSAGRWDPNWTYRRVVTVGNIKATGLGGDEIAVATMSTGGLIAEDGSDIHVATLSGRRMPHRVLMIGPGDQVRIAFAMLPGISKYYVYFGYKDKGRKPTPGAELVIRRGVLMETWEYLGGQVKTLSQAWRIFERTSKLIGRDFRKRIFQGYNPFGPQNRLATIFTGYLICPASGSYTFATSSRDASFLLVDDKLIVDNGGFHGPQRDARKQGRVDLSAGLHKLTFYHVVRGGYPIAVAAWRPPGGERIWPIPAIAFAPVYLGMPGPVECYGKAVTVDFIPVHAGEAFIDGSYYQRYSFKSLTSGRGGPAAQRSAVWNWDFGDGQSSADKNVEHVYLLDGEYEVTLTARTFAGELARTNRINVARRWDEVTVRGMDSAADYANIVSAYKFTELSPPALAKAVRLLQSAGLGDEIIRAGETLLTYEEAPGKAIETVIAIYSDVLAARGRGKQAIRDLSKAAEMTTNPAACAALLVRASRIALDRLGDDKQALDLFNRVIRKYAVLDASPSIRQARIGVGDVWRLRGDFEKAREAYTSAGTSLNIDASRTAIAKGDFARQVEDFIRQGDFNAAAEKLDEWEQAFPLDKLGGFSSLLRVRLQLAWSKPSDAVLEAERLVAVNPRSNYAAELLSLAAEAYQKAGQIDEAAKALSRIVDEYPESSLAVEAAKRLQSR